MEKQKKLEQQIFKFQVKAMIFKILKFLLIIIGTFLGLMIIGEVPGGGDITFKWFLCTKILPIPALLILGLLGSLFSSIEMNYREQAHLILENFQNQ